MLLTDEEATPLLGSAPNFFEQLELPSQQRSKTLTTNQKRQARTFSILSLISLAPMIPLSQEGLRKFVLLFTKNDNAVAINTWLTGSIVGVLTFIPTAYFMSWGSYRLAKGFISQPQKCKWIKNKIKYFIPGVIIGGGVMYFAYQAFVEFYGWPDYIGVPIGVLAMLFTGVTNTSFLESWWQETKYFPFVYFLRDKSACGQDLQQRMLLEKMLSMHINVLEFAMSDDMLTELPSTIESEDQLMLLVERLSETDLQQRARQKFKQYSLIGTLLVFPFSTYAFWFYNEVGAEFEKLIVTSIFNSDDRYCGTNGLAGRIIVLGGVSAIAQYCFNRAITHRCFSQYNNSQIRPFLIKGMCIAVPAAVYGFMVSLFFTDNLPTAIAVGFGNIVISLVQQGFAFAAWSAEKHTSNTTNEKRSSLVSSLQRVRDSVFYYPRAVVEYCSDMFTAEAAIDSSFGP